MTVNCPVLDCFEMVPRNTVLAHIQEKNHPVTKLINGQRVLMEIKLDDCQADAPSFSTTNQIDFDNRHFFLEKTRARSGSWYSWVYFSGFINEAVNYMATIKIYESNGYRSLTYVGDVIPMDIDFLTIRANQNGLMFKDGIVKSFLSHEDSFETSCTIKKL
jgi:hypothetical protein